MKILKEKIFKKFSWRDKKRDLSEKNFLKRGPGKVDKRAERKKWTGSKILNLAKDICLILVPYFSVA